METWLVAARKTVYIESMVCLFRDHLLYKTGYSCLIFFPRSFWLLYLHTSCVILLLNQQNKDVLLNIHANVKNAWKYVGSDSYGVWNGRIYSYLKGAYKWAFKISLKHQMRE